MNSINTYHEQVAGSLAELDLRYPTYPRRIAPMDVYPGGMSPMAEVLQLRIAQWDMDDKTMEKGKALLGNLIEAEDNVDAFLDEFGYPNMDEDDDE